MNERNVEALEAEIEDALRALGGVLGGETGVRAVAELLAAQGVLAPWALTDEDAKNGDSFGAHEQGWDSGQWYELRRDDMVSALMGIAQGHG